MTKYFASFALVCMVFLTACGPEDIPMPQNPMRATISENQQSLLHPQVYEGDEVAPRIHKPGEIQTRCEYEGVVEFINDDGTCRFVIHLEEGPDIIPINYNKLPVKIRNEMAVKISFETVRVSDNACELGVPANITCITALRGVVKR
ncbi:MAG: hypothetical protein AAFQ87_00070 [Bacteroidota bacterium]